MKKILRLIKVIYLFIIGRKIVRRGYHKIWYELYKKDGDWNHYRPI